MNCCDIIRNKKGVMGCLIGAIVSFVVIAAVIGGVVGYLFNTTPAKLKVDDIEFSEGLSLRSLGLADTKFKDIIKQFKQLANADTSKVVQNAPTDEDKTETDSNLADTDSLTDGEGNTDYTLLLTNTVTYDNQYLLTYADTNLAYIFSQIIKQGIDKTGDESNESIKFLQKLNANVSEITISNKTEDGVADVRLVVGINSAAFKDKIKEALGAAAGLLPIKIPDVIYLVSTFTVSAAVTPDGKLIMTSVNLKINDTENAISKALFKGLASVGGGSTEMDEDEQKAFINDKIGDAFEIIVYNLGKVGTATVGSGNLISGDIVYGASGISNGSLTVITHVE